MVGFKEVQSRENFRTSQHPDEIGEKRDGVFVGDGLAVELSEAPTMRYSPGFFFGTMWTGKL